MEEPVKNINGILKNQYSKCMCEVLCFRTVQVVLDQQQNVILLLPHDNPQSLANDIIINFLQ